MSCSIKEIMDRWHCEEEAANIMLAV